MEIVFFFLELNVVFQYRGWSLIVAMQGRVWWHLFAHKPSLFDLYYLLCFTYNKWLYSYFSEYL